MAPKISPKKTWEAWPARGGLPGRRRDRDAAAAAQQVWYGLVLGRRRGAATLGDLVESMIKGDLTPRTCPRSCPGTAGCFDRIDAMLVVAPVAWLLMTIFLGRR